MSVRATVLLGVSVVRLMSIGLLSMGCCPVRLLLSSRVIVRSGYYLLGKCPSGFCLSGMCPRRSVCWASVQSGYCPDTLHSSSFSSTSSLIYIINTLLSAFSLTRFGTVEVFLSTPFPSLLSTGAEEERCIGATYWIFHLPVLILFLHSQTLLMPPLIINHPLFRRGIGLTIALGKSSSAETISDWEDWYSSESVSISDDAEFVEESASDDFQSFFCSMHFHHCYLNYTVSSAAEMKLRKLENQYHKRIQNTVKHLVWSNFLEIVNFYQIVNFL